MKRYSILLVLVVLLVNLNSPVGQAQQPLDSAAIDAYIVNHMAEHRIPGLALCIVHNDEIVYAQGYGVAGPDGTPVTPQTPFIIGSSSKSLTALAIMQLVEAGEIELDAPVQTYLPWFTMKDPERAAQITVRHLLAQTSGLAGPVSDKDVVNPDTSEDALETHIRELAEYRLARPVGEGFKYNNVNYDILGLIVQTVSGQSFEDYVEEQIYSPLAMTHSYASKAKAETDGLAAGHTYFFGSPRVLAGVPYSRRKVPSGFLISSAEDLGHFLIAQLNGGRYGAAQILSPEYVATMQQPAIEKSTEGVSYAFGWDTRLVGGEPSVWHEGNTSNYHSNLAFSPTRGWGVAVVMNASGFPQLAALNEPINEIMRLASGYEAGQPIQDQTPVILILWGIAILSAVLNLLFLWLSWRRRVKQGRRLGLVRYLLLPPIINLLPVWLMFVEFPRQGDSILSAMPVFLPDTTVIFVVSTAVIVLTLLARIVVYWRFARVETHSMELDPLHRSTRGD